MILDRGICTIYTRTDVSEPGEMPRYEKTVKTQSYYGEMDFETAPAWPTEHRKETKTDARVRILQHRGIQKGDTAELEDFSDEKEPVKTYKITRAYHGTDDDSGEAITDLSLEAMEP